MANKKELQKAASEFHKGNPNLHYKYAYLLSKMSRFIKELGAAEVVAGFQNGELYRYANDKH